VSDKVIDNLNKIRAIDSVMEIVLNEKERKFIAEYYWQNKTQEQLADGRYDLYSIRSITRYIKRICNKLSKGGLLKVI
jgi:DNA-directed RNA polymerase specialized sigma subunit